ncbi:uncharacterized protein LOC141676751 [Apium graveolens]|uniref:uncharacterized protein LOC141676751 n=1 Tax=Apium graveolens TaxID=4045 RepID=UPI003D79F181
MLKFLPGVDVVDAPDVVARVFKMKVDQLLDEIKNKNCFGRCIGVMHVIEFQKRGLPHAHMLIWLHSNDRPKIIEQIDKMVSAEIPDPSIDPVGYETVTNYMIYGPCGTNCVKSPCMVKGRCIKHFPKRLTKYTESFRQCWNKEKQIRSMRKRGDVIGRLAEVHSSSGELLYLRMLLLRIKGVVCFDDLKTVNGHVHNSFHEACAALVYSPISHPRNLWEAHWGCMSDDILLVRRHLTGNPNLCLSDIEIQNYALAEKLLNGIGKSLRNFPDIPYPGYAFFSNSENRLILEETSYDTEEMKRIHTRNHSLLNDEQKIVYDSNLDNINQKKGGVFFVYGSGGCGKTFLWQTLCCRLRSEHKIVLPVASCGIAAMLLPGGRTAHFRFHIPLKLDENCSAGLRHGTDISELL